MTNTMPERFESRFGDEFNNVKGNKKIVKTGTNIDDIIDFFQSEIDLSKKEGQEEYKQFILNILDGIDIADGECNTKAIRLAINSRVI